MHCHPCKRCPNPSAPPPLSPEAAARFAEFARACKAAARAVALVSGQPPRHRRFALRGWSQARAAAGRDGRSRSRSGRALLLDGALPQPGPGDRRTRRGAVPAHDRRADRQSPARTRTPGGRCSCCWRARLRKCAPTAASRDSGPRPAVPASISSKSTMPKSCARSRAKRRPSTKSSPPRSPVRRFSWTMRRCSRCSPIVGHPEKLEQLMTAARGVDGCGRHRCEDRRIPQPRFAT